MVEGGLGDLYGGSPGVSVLLHGKEAGVGSASSCPTVPVAACPGVHAQAGVL